MIVVRSCALREWGKGEGEVGIERIPKARRMIRKKQKMIRVPNNRL